MSQTYQWRVLKGSHYEAGKLYTQGSIVETANNLGAAFKNKFELVQETAGGPPPRPSTMVGQNDREPTNPIPTRGKKREEETEKQSPPPPPGKNVTDRFPAAVEQDCAVFKDGTEYWIYDQDDLTKPLNDEAVKKEAVEKTIQKIFQ